MKMIDLTGKKFGRLTVVKKSHSVGNRKQIKWDCICECGAEKTIEGGTLKQIKSKYCCENMRVSAGSPNVRHGMSKSRIYRIYKHMKNRCYNKNVDSYPIYGARGISVCDEWMQFEPFYKWAMDNGYQENLSIDRINNNLGYFPGNCRWATTTDQARNTRRNVCTMEMAEEIRKLRSEGVRNKDIADKFNIARTTVSDVTYKKSWADGERFYAEKIPMFTFDGETKTATEWQRDSRISVSYGTILRRRKSGMSDYDCLFSKKKTHNKKPTELYDFKKLKQPKGKS